MAIPSIALIPTGTKAGKLYSVLPEDGSGDFTVVRATTATRVNENGLIESVANNVPRLDYTNGGCPVLLTEPQSTNLITYPLSFDNAYWIKSGLSVVSGQSSPSADSPTGAFKLVESSANELHRIRTSSITRTSGITYTISIYVKPNGRLIFINAVAFCNANSTFDLSNGTIADTASGTAKIELLSNGWYRCSVTGTATATGSTVFYTQINNTGFGDDSYQGDGTSGVYIFGGQVEALSYPTSLMLPLTEGSITTRNADQVTDSGDVNDFNSTEGVLMAEISALYDDLTFRVISLSDGTSSNSIWLYYSADSNVIKIYDGTNALAYSTDTTVNSKVAYVYDAVSTRLYINGFNVGSIAFKSFSGFNNLTFKDEAGTNPFYGKTKQIQVFKSALTNLEIETLTSWESFILMASAQQYIIY